MIYGIGPRLRFAGGICLSFTCAIWRTQAHFPDAPLRFLTRGSCELLTPSARRGTEVRKEEEINEQRDSLSRNVEHRLAGMPRRREVT